MCRRPLRSGDIVFADVDGVVIIPQERATEVIARAREEAAGEDSTRDELRRGRLLADVVAKFGIL